MGRIRGLLWLAVMMVANGGAFAGVPVDADEDAGMFAKLSAFITVRSTETDRIDDERRVRLDELAGVIRDERDRGIRPSLTFICTHNSRRSHMAMLWAAAAARVHGVDIAVSSGGTESTAFNPRGCRD
jgi:arsenate reductase